MQYDQKQFTQKGLNMFTSALSQKQPIVIDKVIVDDLPTNNFSNLALLSMDSFADALSYQANYTTVNGNMLTVDAVMSNKDFNSSYTINEVGLVGHINNDMSSQALIAVLVASDPFTLPAQQSGETPSQFIPNITLSFGDNNMNQVPVMVSDSAYIAQKDLDRLVSEYNYLKIGDADNRYVKQQDFNNEVNGAINNKTDKSYVDQSTNQAINHSDENYNSLNNMLDETNGNVGDNSSSISSLQNSLNTTNNNVNGNSSSIDSLKSNKADKSDLNTVQSNINTDIQPQLNSKANQSDLNTTNSNISSIQSNKADKGDVNGQINQTLSQATAHSDQNLSTATSHSDSNYNDLSNKNNILFSKIDDGLSQKGQLQPGTDLNDVRETGLYTIGSVGNANLPNEYTGYQWGYLLVFKSEVYTDDAFQIFYGYGVSGYMRRLTSYDVAPWKRITNQDDIDKINNKINDLSNQISSNKSTTDQQFSQNSSDIATANQRIDSLNNDKADASDVTNKWSYLSYQMNQLASKSWRELNVAGISKYKGGHCVCRIDWNNNEAHITGTINDDLGYPNNESIVIYPSSDFTFNDGITSQMLNNANSSTGYNAIGMTNISSGNGNLYTNLSYGINIFADLNYNEIKVPITPK